MCSALQSRQSHSPVVQRKVPSVNGLPHRAHGVGRSSGSRTSSLIRVTSIKGDSDGPVEPPEATQDVSPRRRQQGRQAFRSHTTPGPGSPAWRALKPSAEQEEFHTGSVKMFSDSVVGCVGGRCASGRHQIFVGLPFVMPMVRDGPADDRPAEGVLRQSCMYCRQPFTPTRKRISSSTAAGCGAPFQSPAKG
jgi:hypothetical protein